MPFGEELNADATYRTSVNKFGATDNVRQKFTGYLKDNETSLDFAEARYYNNQHGRFTAVDPLLASGKSSNPQTFNRYVYCLNNPVIFSDPTGLEANWYYNQKEDRYMYSADDKTFTDGSEVNSNWSVREIDSTGVFYFSAMRGEGTDLAYLAKDGTYGFASDRNNQTTSTTNSSSAGGSFPIFAFFQFRSPTKDQFRSFNPTFGRGANQFTRWGTPAATNSVQIPRSWTQLPDGSRVSVAFNPNTIKETIRNDRISGPNRTGFRSIEDGVPFSQDLVKSAQQLYPNKAGKIELHHPIPQFLGGPKKQ